jgi:hypothetical protein
MNKKCRISDCVFVDSPLARNTRFAPFLYIERDGAANSGLR